MTPTSRNWSPLYRRAIRVLLGVIVVIGAAGSLELTGRQFVPETSYLCFPSCSENDGRFLTLAVEFDTLSGQEIAFRLMAAPSASELKVGLFDADGEPFTTSAPRYWDNPTDGAPSPELRFRVYRDPGEVGAGAVSAPNLVAEWTSANALFLDNEWSDMAPIATDELARSAACTVAANCPFNYYMTVAVIPSPIGTDGLPTVRGPNNFKVRTDGTIGLKSNVFAFYAPVSVRWPGGTAQSNLNYDGSWLFGFELPASANSVEVWDGDFDYGDYLCANLDTDDLDTPNTDSPFPYAAFFSSPSVAEGVAVGAIATSTSIAAGGCTIGIAGVGVGSPWENQATSARRREPRPWLGAFNVAAELTDPDGNRYANRNPSGNKEWERFRVSTDPFDANQMDYHADSLPAGIYTHETSGMDLGNLNSYYFNYDLLGLPPSGPPPSISAFYTIQRYVWLDTDRDGMFDNNFNGVNEPGEELGIPNVTVARTDNATGRVVYATTDALGQFTFRVPAGSYSLEVVPSNFNTGKPLAGLGFTGGNGFGATGNTVTGLELGPTNPYERRDFGYITNTPPTTVNDADVCLCTGGTTIDVLANDSDVDNDALTVTAITQPVHGTTTLNGDGTVSYAPTSGYTGSDSFTYTVADGRGGVSIGTVTLSVINNAPVLVADSGTTQAGTPVTVNVLANDSDPDGQTLSISAFSQGANGGTVVLNGDGTMTYTPAPGFSGTDTFTYTVTDGCGSVTTTVTIIVNTPPTTPNDTAACLCTTTTTIDVLANDTDADNDTLTVTAITQPANGVATLNGDGTVTYDPNAGFTGTDTFTYTVTDARGATSTGTVTVTSNNQAPVLVADSASIQTGQSATIAVLANDSDPDGQTLTVSSFTQAANGTVVQNGDGSMTYTPNPGFAGTDSFTYTVSDGCAERTTTVTIVVNGPPTARNDAGACLCTTTTTFNLLANDSDPNNDALTITAITQPTNGVVTLGTGGNVTYDPNAGFTGNDTFTYTVSDGRGGSAVGTVTVTSNNQAPVLVADSGSTTGVNPVTIAVLANDSDPDGQALTISSFTQPASGGTVVRNANGTMTFTPASGFSGTATFTYTVTDGCAERTTTVTITVTNTPPPCDTNGFVTYSQGGWGSKPQGGNPGAFLAANFASVYPNGVTIGGNKTLKFTSASAIQNYLPAGGGASVLSYSYTNPTSSQGVLSAQLLAVKLAVDFSAAGKTKVGLGQLVFTSGPAAGQTLNQVLAMANTVFGGQTSALPSGMTLSGLTSLLESVVMNFHEGTVNGGLLGCGSTPPPPPPPPPCMANAFTLNQSSASNGTAGNVRTFTSSGASVRVVGFSREKNTGAWAKAYVGAFGSYGLGVTDTSEDGASVSHTVDNSGRVNYLAFVFDGPVVVKNAFLGYVSGDSDAQVWVGNIPGASAASLMLSDAVLAGLGTPETSDGGSSTRTVAFNAGGESGNVVVIAAKTTESNDYFKVAKIETECGSTPPPPPPPPTCIATAFTLDQSSSSTGAFGNVRSFTSAGATVRAVAFSRDKSTGQWSDAYLGAFGTYGLGVTDGSESGSGTSHTVDNNGRNNYIAFVFDQPTVVQNGYLGWISGDSDAQIWIGTVPGATASTLVLSDAILSDFGAPETNLGPSQSTNNAGRAFTFNAAAKAGNVVVIAAKTDESNDYFKVAKIETECGAGDPPPPPPIDSCEFRTQTPGGWGAAPSGNNPGAFLAANFSRVFGSNVKIGVGRTLTFTSASAIEAFLPQGGTAGSLSSSATNPTSSSAGVFAGHVLALKISVAFSEEGVTQSGLADLTVKSGALAGKTVGQVLAMAETALGGGSVPGVSISTLLTVVSSINENFVDGTKNAGYLNCSCPTR